jgi:predicted  nucleic acid-binding Zn-ribbon protein
MANAIEPLVALQELEFAGAASKLENAAEIARLRASISAQILAYYDRLMVRGKTGVALVRHGVCAGCHMRLSTGQNADLLRDEDILTCPSCGRYLYAIAELPETTTASQEFSRIVPVPAKRLRTRSPRKVAEPQLAPAA